MRDISIFDYVNSSILGGICIASQNIADDKNGVISSCDIASLYPYIMTKRLPIGTYRFIKYFNKNQSYQSVVNNSPTYQKQFTYFYQKILYHFYCFFHILLFIYFH